MTNEQRLLTGAEVARILQISKPYAYRLMQRGEVTTVRIGRCVRVRPEDLQRYIEANVHVAAGLAIAVQLQ